MIFTLSFFVFSSCSSEEKNNDLNINSIEKYIKPLQSTSKNQETDEYVSGNTIVSSCFNGSGGCSSPIFETITISLSDYPDCDIEVDVYYCKENDDLYTHFLISDYEWHDIQSLAVECPELWEDWEEIILNNDTDGPQYPKIEFIQNIDEQVYSELEDYFFSTLDEVTNCNHGGQETVIDFISVSCKSSCTYYFTPDGSSSSYSFFITQPCESTGCCRRRTNICYNIFTNTIQKDVYFSTIGPDECDDAPVEAIIELSWASKSDCTPCYLKCK